MSSPTMSSPAGSVTDHARRICWSSEFGRILILSRVPLSPWPVQTALLGLSEGILAILDGLAAYRHWERLRSRGVAHGTALRSAFGLSCAHR
jgi:hypothetical protein